jgi:hypothetical protein
MMGAVHQLASALGVLPIEKVPLAVNARGSWHQLPDAIPALDPFYFSWEKNFDALKGSEFARANNWIPVTCVILYGIGILLGQRYMKDREAFDLRWTLAAWNLLLSLFSCWGMVRTAPHLFYNLYAFNFEDTLCKPAIYMYGCGATGMWVQFFILSKIPELFDTVFIVLRKKPLVFLHWYHHITVLLFCWHSYVTESPGGIYFAAMNYAVHFVMYGYYFLMASRKLPKWFPAGIVTIAQISQMIVGVVLTVFSGYYYTYPKASSVPVYRPLNGECDVKWDNLVAGGVMYASYFALFVHFAIERYWIKPQRKKLAGKKVE